MTDRSTPVSSTVDVQRYGIPGALRPSSSIVGLPPSRSSSLMLWLLRDRSTTVLRLSTCRDTLSPRRALRPSSPQSSYVCRRAGTRCLHYPGLKRLFPVLWLLRDRSTPVLRLSTGRDTPSPALPLRRLTCRCTLIPGFTTPVLQLLSSNFQGHSVSGILRLPSPPVLRYGC